MKRTKLPLTQQATQALSEAIAKVVEEHRRHARPFALWRDGKAVWVSATEIGALRKTALPYRTKSHEGSLKDDDAPPTFRHPSAFRRTPTGTSLIWERPRPDQNFMNGNRRRSSKCFASTRSNKTFHLHTARNTLIFMAFKQENNRFYLGSRSSTRTPKL
ncbi:MAG TPA: hypothetical protein VN673_04055 [Clostridia bacterium]|nr:hypothetical protein [Clostridia bacterium]